MDKTEDSSTIVFRNCFLVLGVLSAIGPLGYGLAYIIVMPQVSPGGIVPTTPGSSSGPLPTLERSWRHSYFCGQCNDLVDSSSTVWLHHLPRFSDALHFKGNMPKTGPVDLHQQFGHRTA